jgi:integrase
MPRLRKLTFTRWVNAAGDRVSKDTPGAKKKVEESAKWYAQLTDLSGRRRHVPLSTDKRVASQMLTALRRDSDLARVGLNDPCATHMSAPIAAHVTDYEAYLRHRGVSAKHLAETLRRLWAVLEGIEARTLAEMRPEKVDRFLASLAGRNAGARTQNTYRSSAKAFSRWCVKSRRCREDVLAGIEPAAGATRRERRSLTEDELARLLRVARERPLREAMTVRTGKRKGQAVARVGEDVQEGLKRLGWERSLIYRTMILTGLRRGEVAALQVRNLDLEGDRPRLFLPAANTKNRDDAEIPLRADLAEGLAEWVRATGRVGTALLFRVPIEFVKILRRDLAGAGIPYRDEHGRTFDVHALRHTTATYLGRGKVTPRIAQQFMRHSDVKLTLQNYSDHRMLDETEALDALPKLPPIREVVGSEEGSPR